MIPAADLDRIARPASLAVTLTERGGHCGYMESIGMQSWAERQIGNLFDRAAG